MADPIVKYIEWLKRPWQGMKEQRAARILEVLVPALEQIKDQSVGGHYDMVYADEHGCQCTGHVVRNALAQARAIAEGKA